MATNVNPDKIKDDTDTILGVWKANTDFRMKEVTLEGFETDGERLETVLKSIETKEQDLVPLRKERDDLARKLNDINTRARSSMKGFFGPNSSQYKQAGGTRAIERKKPARQASSSQASK